jgi:ABC-2 type transport system permease protein
MLGFGFRSSFQLPGTQRMSALEYLYPGSIVLNILFTAIFSSISLIQDRNEGFLQAVLVAPLSRAALVFGKISGGTALAATQGVLFLILAPFIGIHLTFLSFLVSAFTILLISFALTAVGFLFAWRMQSVQGFHAIMNLILMPLWILSGSFFPSVGAPWGLKMVMFANPLTYGVIALRQSFYLSGAKTFYEAPGLGISLLVTLVFGLAIFVLASGLARSTTKGDLQ